MALRFSLVLSIGGTVSVLGYYGYAATLPKLDPTGTIPADAAFAAMIRGEPVYDTARWRVLFRRDYEAPAEKSK